MKNFLTTEIYKVKNCLSPEILKGLKIRSSTHLMNRNIHAAHFGTDTITNLRPNIWKLVPDEIKNASSLLVFKTKIKTWTNDNCSCRVCKTFVKDLRFIETFPIL